MNIDPISDMLVRIKNAQARKKSTVEMPYSKLKDELAKVLVQKGFLLSSKTFKEKGGAHKFLSFELKYDANGMPQINSLQRVSKPSLRIYKDAKSIKPVLGNLGFDILSTSKGIISSDEASKRHLGGEALCRVY